MVVTRCADEAELIRVEPLGALHGEAVLQRLPRVAADDVRRTAFRAAEQPCQYLEIGELVGRREQRVSFLEHTGVPVERLLERRSCRHTCWSSLSRWFPS